MDSNIKSAGSAAAAMYSTLLARLLCLIKVVLPLHRVLKDALLKSISYVSGAKEVQLASCIILCTG